MAARVQLNTFASPSISMRMGRSPSLIFPLSWREVVAALDPAHRWGTTCAFHLHRRRFPQQRTLQFVRPCQRIWGEQRVVADACRRMVGEQGMRLDCRCRKRN